MKKILIVIGTRPEAIKCAPVVRALKESRYEVIVCSTGQHREMLDQVLNRFEVKADFELDIMRSGQTLEHIGTTVLQKIEPIIRQVKPDLLLVQGDTSTAFFASLAGFYHKVSVGHIEAGLRTNDKYNPFPEEINRRLISQIADIHFVPTETAKQNLLAEGIDANTIHVTGNTVIDALIWATNKQAKFSNPKLGEITKFKRLILLTTHRRENLGGEMQNIFQATTRLAREYPDVGFIYPVHLNPAIQQHAKSELSSQSNIILTEPLDYFDLAKVLGQCYMVLTDSGGLQEEAPALGKPVLVLRKTTERPEGIESGTAKLIGTDEVAIYEETKRLLDDGDYYQKMAEAVNPYGDGNAADKIVGIIDQYVAPI